MRFYVAHFIYRNARWRAKKGEELYINSATVKLYGRIRQIRAQKFTTTVVAILIIGCCQEQIRVRKRMKYSNARETIENYGHVMHNHFYFWTYTIPTYHSLVDSHRSRSGELIGFSPRSSALRPIEIPRWAHLEKKRLRSLPSQTFMSVEFQPSNPANSRQ